MSWMLWLPFWIGIAMLLVAVPLILSIQLRNETQAISGGEGPEMESLLRRSSLDIKRERQSGRTVLGGITDTFKAVVDVLKKPNFRLLLAVFSLASLASSNTPLLSQYISKRYGWTFAQAGYLLSIKAAVNIILLTVLVPFGIRYLTKNTAMSGTDVNITAANISLMLSVLGALMVAISFEIWQLIPCKPLQSATPLTLLIGHSILHLRRWFCLARLHHVTSEVPCHCRWRQRERTRLQYRHAG
jgi:hypothetical protein